MSDDLVKRLWEEATADTSTCSKLTEEAASRIEKLEALVEQLRDDNSSLIDSFDKDFLRQEARIEKLEAALAHIYAWYPISLSEPIKTLHEIRDYARKALEAKDD